MTFPEGWVEWMVFSFRGMELRSPTIPATSSARISSLTRKDEPDFLKTAMSVRGQRTSGDPDVLVCTASDCMTVDTMQAVQPSQSHICISNRAPNTRRRFPGR
jgi:hypothetical protein